MMERLTKRIGSRVRLSGIEDPRKLRIIADRLAAYEDLGTVESLSALVKAKEEGRLVSYGPGDVVWDRFGMMWQVGSSEIHLLDGKPTPMYRCGHPGTDDYCALWAPEALDKEAGTKAAEVWAAEISTYVGLGTVENLT